MSDSRSGCYVAAWVLLSVSILAPCGCSTRIVNTPAGRELERKPSTMHDSAPLLTRNPVNPRYFADPEGKAVYLTGSHTWNNLQDKGEGDPPVSFDWAFYLDFLVEHNHNFIRLWSGQTIRHGDGPVEAAQMPWLRTGPGEAIDGKPRFDLTAFDPAYFERLRERVRTAGQRGIYVDVMMFEGWCATVRNPVDMEYHVFAEGNNINGVNILATPRSGIYARWVTLDDPEVVKLQELYVAKVVEAVNEFDNVLYEIANEPTGLSHPWQEHFIAHIRSIEADLAKQHPIGAPGGMKTHNRKMFAGSADWVSPDIHAPDDDQSRRYQKGTMTWGEPDYDNGDKVVILDTDHLWGIGGNVAWAWKSFCRGYNVLYMDPAEDFPGAFFKGTPEWPAEPNQDLRREMGVIRSYAERVDLNRTVPHNDLCSTGYCLAEPGKAYIAFQPQQGPFTVTVEPGRYAVQWHFADTGETLPAEPMDVPPGPHSFDPPRSGAAVLFLERL